MLVQLDKAQSLHSTGRGIQTVLNQCDKSVEFCIFLFVLIILTKARLLFELHNGSLVCGMSPSSPPPPPPCFSFSFSRLAVINFRPCYIQLL